MDRELVQIIVVALPVVINAVTRLISAVSELLAKNRASKRSLDTDAMLSGPDASTSEASTRRTDGRQYQRGASTTVRIERHRRKMRKMLRDREGGTTNSENEYNND